MSTIEEKRVFEGGRRHTLYLATGLGIARVAVSDDLVGEFGLLRRGDAADVAADVGLLAAAADGDVRVGPTLDPTDFGPAAAVGVGGDAILAVTSDGTVARYGADRGDDAGSWRSLGEVVDPGRFDRSLLAAADGVRRVGDGLADLGLADATLRDICAADPGFAATENGLYRRTGTDWTRERDGPHRVVAGRGDRVHAVTEGGDLVARREAEWEVRSLPTAERVVDLGYARAAVYAVTEAGTVLADAGDGWRSRATGLRPVRAAAVGPEADATGDR
jgi:hypothetical protein